MNFALWGLVVVPTYVVVRQVGIVHWGSERTGLSRSDTLEPDSANTRKTDGK